VALIGALGDAFGDAGLQRVLGIPLARARSGLRQQIGPSLSLKEKASEAGAHRTEEGYMAEVTQKNGAFCW